MMFHVCSSLDTLDGTLDGEDPFMDHRRNRPWLPPIRGNFLVIFAAFNGCIYEPDRPISWLDAGHVWFDSYNSPPHQCLDVAERMVLPVLIGTRTAGGDILQIHRSVILLATGGERLPVFHGPGFFPLYIVTEDKDAQTLFDGGANSLLYGLDRFQDLPFVDFAADIVVLDVGSF